MAHTVTFKTPKLNLGKADVVFEIRDESGMIGTLKISRGSLVWFPSDTSHGYRVGWSRFNKLIRENITESESR